MIRLLYYSSIDWICLALQTNNKDSCFIQVQKLEALAFSRTPELVWLDLEINKIEIMEIDCFSGLDKLER